MYCKHLGSNWTLIVLIPSACRLEQHNMTTKDAYQYFVLRAQEMAVSHDWIPVNWYVLGSFSLRL